jgi:(p)ppGpp synthase/HD superfamily hydrolase
MESIWKKIASAPYYDDVFSVLAAAFEYHHGQKDWSGDPYINHVLHVMDMLPEDSSLERRQIALLHDVIEDCWEGIYENELGIDPTGLTLTEEVARRVAEHLRDDLSVSQHVIDGVLLVTRYEAPGTYMDKIRALVESGHTDAMWVKLCDNKHNTCPDRYSRLSPERLKRAEEMRPRYERSMKILCKGLGIV